MIRRFVSGLVAFSVAGGLSVAHADPPKADAMVEIKERPKGGWPWERKLSFEVKHNVESIVPMFKVGDMGKFSFPNTIGNAYGDDKPKPYTGHFRLVHKESAATILVQFAAWQPTHSPGGYELRQLPDGRLVSVNDWGPPFRLQTFGRYVFDGIDTDKFSPDHPVELPDVVWEVCPVGIYESAEFVFREVDLKPYRAAFERLKKEDAKDRDAAQAKTMAALTAKVAPAKPLAGQSPDEWFTVTLKNDAERKVVSATVTVTRGTQTETVRFKEVPAGKSAKKTVRLKGKGKVECKVASCSI